MKSKYIVCILSLVLMFSLVGCDNKKHGSLSMEDSDITVQYLRDEYVPQLMKDEAEKCFGNITLDKNEKGDIIVGIDVKVIVDDLQNEGSFYLENTNLYREIKLVPTAKCTFTSGNVDLLQVLTANEFYKAFIDEKEKKGENYEKSKFFDVYLINDEAVLVMENELKINSTEI